MKAIAGIMFIFLVFPVLANAQDQRKSFVDYYADGNEYFNIGDYKSAVENYNKALELKPGYEYAQQKLLEAKRELALESDNYKDVINAVNGKKYEYDQARYSLLIKYSLKFGENKKALKYADELVKKYPDDAGAYYERGSAREKTGDSEGALKDYAKALNLNPAFPQAFAAKNSLLELKDAEKRIKNSKNPEEKSAAYSEKAKIEWTKGQYEQALKDYGQALSVSAEDAVNIYNSIGAVKVGQGDYKGSVEDYTKAIELGNDLSYYNRGVAEYLDGDYKSAVSDLDISLKKHPEMIVASTYKKMAEWKMKDNYTPDAQKEELSRKYYEAGKKYLYDSKFDEAADMLDKSVELYPYTPAAYQYRGIAYLQTKKYEEAVKDFNLYLDFSPDDTGVYQNRGIAKMNAHDAEGAIEDFTQAVKIDPKNDMAYVWRGFVKSTLGNYQDAIKDHNKAIELNPENGLAYQFRGMARLDMKQKNEGVADLKKAASLGMPLAGAILAQLGESAE